MSDFEQQLRRRLTGRAATVAPRGDLDDLVERIAKQRARGRRASAFAMALVVVIGPIAGFGIARATDGSTARSASTHHTSKPAVSKAPTFSATPLPPLKANGASSGESLGAAMPPNGLLIAPGDQLSLGRMFARTSSDGIALRVYGAALPAQPATVPWFTPAPWCSPNRLVQVDTSNDLVAGTSRGYLYEKPQNDLAASSNLVGTSEGAPVWVAVVQSDKGTTARATFADGGSDSAALDDGVAVLAHAVAKPADLQTLQGEKLDVQILDAGGSVVAEAPVYGNGETIFGNGGDPDPAACTAPAKLPDPGPEQPADVAAATAGVTQAFADVLTGSSSLAVREAAIDDPHSLDDVYSKLLSGSFAQYVKTAVPHVRNVVFLSATEAAVEYDVSIPNYTDLNGQFGEAVFSGGRWKVTRETFCTQIGMAGVSCPP
jgi:hypothetical protein